MASPKVLRDCCTLSIVTTTCSSTATPTIKRVGGTRYLTVCHVRSVAMTNAGIANSGVIERPGIAKNTTNR